MIYLSLLDNSINPNCVATCQLRRCEAQKMQSTLAMLLQSYNIFLKNEEQ